MSTRYSITVTFQDGTAFSGSVYGEDAFDALQNFAAEQADLRARLESGEKYTIEYPKEI